MTDQNQPSQGNKKRPPEYDCLQEIQAGKGTRLINVGAMWDTANGNIAGDTAHGRFIIKRREALNEMRQQNQQAQSQEQVQTQAPDMSQ